MPFRVRVLWSFAALALATPAPAQAPAPTTTAFDGTYAGVSRTLLPIDSGSTRCMQDDQPGPLTITGGVARYNGLRPGRVLSTCDGSVNAQGVLVMHCPYGARLDAQIDGRGTVTGRTTFFVFVRRDRYCSYRMVWQKEDK
jgi:hypothetical protein